ncbi:TniQ family protein [Streptomyces sp. NPDC004647]|uniref:TniQ family protein n=1 Tax=Streptomyces sp. NPDC004647 TaxID=3154671 RepID=UPI0033A2B79A
MTSTLGTFPIRVQPLPGEALDSWLEALAHRLHTPLGDVLAGLGLHAPGPEQADSPSTEMLTRRLTPSTASAISQATGTSVATLHAMTLAHYDQRALVLDPRSGLAANATRWGRSTGSRFCPDCLAESGGRWQLSWRLGWTFACTKHDRLLADLCPQCLSRQRPRPPAMREIPHPGHCRNPFQEDDADSGKRRCDADLAQTATVLLDVGHPAMDAQRLVNAIVDSGTADFGPYADHPQTALDALADLRALVGQILIHAPRRALAERLPTDLPLTTDEVNTLFSPSEFELLARRGMQASKSAAITAVGTTLAVNILTRPDIQQASAAIRWVTEADHGPRPSERTTLLASWGKGTTETLRSVQLAAVGPQLRAVDQLRYRVRTARPSVQPHARTHQRLRSIPTSLWPELALPLVPPQHHHYPIMRPALSCLIGLVGNRQSIDAIAERLGKATTGFMASRMLNYLRGHRQWPDIQTALIHIADELDTHPAPIDYQRRRRIDYTHLLPDDQWAAIARQLGINRGSGTLARLFRNYLFLRISGLPSSMAPSTCIPVNISARSQQAMRYRRLTAEVLAHLDHAAEEFLRRHHVVDEPVTWHPPADILHGLTLPGHHPSRIDIKVLHRLIRESEMTATQAATHLGTTLDVVRCLLDQQPAPDTTERRPRPAPVTDPVRAALDATTFRALYHDQHMSLRTIGELYGVKADVIRGIAAEYSIPTRTPKEYRQLQELSREWLHEQYINRGRSLDDIAAETKMTRSNVAKRLKAQGIPLRPRGGASHSETLRIQTRARQAPRLLRPVLNSPAAEKRLRRFVIASTYPTLQKAARALGLHNSTLVNQINRLVRELGGPLLQRAERSRPMTLTPLGRRVVNAAVTWLSSHEQTADDPTTQRD